MIHTIWKEYGETMTEVLDRCKERDGIIGPATYAGRLDPAAQGEVIILSGDDRYHKDEYLGHDKEYTFDVIIGIASDTDDIFGIVAGKPSNSLLPENYGQLWQSLIGTKSQPLPEFSGYRHKGKPLWSHAIKGDHPEVLTTTTIYSIELLNTQQDTIASIRDEVAHFCKRPSLSGFRLSEILESWQKLPDTPITILTMKTHVSSGTYIRSLVRRYGELISIPCCASHITRDKIISKKSS